MTCIQDWRRKCARLVAAKCALAARVDSFHDKNTHAAAFGIRASTLLNGPKRVTLSTEVREYIMHNIEKAQEPPPARQEKALPRPDEIHGKKRAGKRWVKGCK